MTSRSRTADGKYAVRVSSPEQARVARMVGVREIPGKGLGVVARRDLPAFAKIGTYPGERFRSDVHERLLSRGVAGEKYAVDFWVFDRYGKPSDQAQYVIDPGTPGGRLRKRFAKGAVAPYANEPPPGSRPDLMWVWNLPAYSMELWTLKPVKKGRELTVCYGTDGGYRRDYETSCVSPDMEPQLHVVLSPGAKPVPYDENAIRRAAMRLFGRRGIIEDPELLGYEPFRARDPRTLPGPARAPNSQMGAAPRPTTAAEARAASSRFRKPRARAGEGSNTNTNTAGTGRRRRSST